MPVMCLQVSSQEQNYAAEVALWATAVAAADRVHSSKQVQEGLIGACSAICCPWPALPALLETALPGQPVERVLPCYCPCPVLTHRADMTVTQVHRQTCLWTHARLPFVSAQQPTVIAKQLTNIPTATSYC